MLQQATAPIASNHRPLFLDDYARQRIAFRVGRLAQMFRLSEDEADDLRQDMSLELLKAARRFDPARSRPHTFINRALDRVYMHAARQRRSRRRSAARSPVPISALSHFEPVANEHGQGKRNELDRVKVRLDVHAVLARLPDRLRRVCEALMVSGPREAAAQLGLHRATIYRAIHQIRIHFVAAGMDGAT